MEYLFTLHHYVITIIMTLIHQAVQTIGLDFTQSQKSTLMTQP